MPFVECLPGRTTLAGHAIVGRAIGTIFVFMGTLASQTGCCRIDFQMPPPLIPCPWDPLDYQRGIMASQSRGSVRPQKAIQVQMLSNSGHFLILVSWSQRPGKWGHSERAASLFYAGD